MATSTQNNQMYQLLACDLDGTLVGHDASISLRVRQAVSAVQARGVHVTLATGRGFPEALPFARALDISIPIICYQGGLIKHPLTEETFYRKTMDRGLVREIVRLAHVRNWQLLLYVDEAVFLEVFRHTRSFYRDMLGHNIKSVHDLASVLDNCGTDPAKFLFIGEEVEAGDIQAELNARFDQQMQIVRSHSLFVEGIPLGVNKGIALRRLARHLKVPQSQVMAMGDQGNDIPMLTWAGLGVAMGNGSEDVKAAADWVAPPFSKLGAIAAMERFLLR